MSRLCTPPCRRKPSRFMAACGIDLATAQALTEFHPGPAGRENGNGHRASGHGNGHHVANMFEAVELAETGDHRMGAVQEPKLHFLVGLDILDEKRAGSFPSRTDGDEVIFDHPLHERFGIERESVLGAQ